MSNEKPATQPLIINPTFIENDLRRRANIGYQKMLHAGEQLEKNLVHIRLMRNGSYALSEVEMASLSLLSYLRTGKFDFIANPFWFA